MDKTIKKFLYQLLFSKPKRDSLITVCIYFLLAFALFFSTSASMNTATTPMTTIASFLKQLLFTIAGLCCYYICSIFFHPVKFRKYIGVVVTAEICLLVLAVLMSKAVGGINGNYSWIILPFGMSIQPSEFAKIVSILLVSSLIADRKFKNIDTWKCLRYPVIRFAIMLGIILFVQKDMGSFIICLCVGCLVFLIPDNPKFKGIQTGLLILACLGVCFVVFCLVSEKGQAILGSISTTFAARFRAVTNPSYSDDATREIFYSLLGISKGSIFGVGLGNSVQKFGYLVSSEADYIFPVIVEETGLLGILMVFCPYLLIVAELLRYCKLVKTEAERVILVGAVAYLFLHFFLNIGGVSGLIPLTGIPLLFLSRGGSSLITVMSMMGIAQAIISNYEKEKEERKIETII